MLNSCSLCSLGGPPAPQRGLTKRANPAKVGDAKARAYPRPAGTVVGLPKETPHAATPADLMATRGRERRTPAASAAAISAAVPWGGKTSCGPPILMMQTS